MDAIETQFPSHANQQHFYVAVDRIHFKMETLMDLLGVIGRCRPGLPIVICCCSRDELDFLCSAVADLPSISLSYLYSDLSEKDRALTLEQFRQAIVAWNHFVNTEPDDDFKRETNELKSHLIITTDACLPLASGEYPISSRVLINYELPTRKEIYMRRMAACLAQDGIVVNIVVGGEVVTLKSVEESSGIFIKEMPINISDTL